MKLKLRYKGTVLIKVSWYIPVTSPWHNQLKIVENTMTPHPVLGWIWHG